MPLIQLSTDYVFAGTGSVAYVETDPPGPVGVYGATKYAGELAVAAACPQHVILRTAWVHSPHGTNFVRTMLRLAASRAEIGVVDDQIGNPTYAPHLASAIIAIAQRMRQPGPPAGIYHAAGSGETTWAGFAREIFRLSAARGGPLATVNPITTAQFPTPARRPANSRLDCGKLARDFSLALPDWPDGTAACIARLLP